MLTLHWHCGHRECRASFSTIEGAQACAAKLGEPAHQGTILVPADVLYHRRDLTVANAASAGYVVQTSIGSYIEMRNNRSVCDKMGVERVINQRDHLLYSKQTGGPVITWQTNEASPATESTPAFVQLSAPPKTVTAYYEISRQAPNQMSPGAEHLFRSSLADGDAIAQGNFIDLAGDGQRGLCGIRAGVATTDRGVACEDEAGPPIRRSAAWVRPARRSFLMSPSGINQPPRILAAFGNAFSCIHRAMVLGCRFKRSDAMRMVKSFCIAVPSGGWMRVWADGLAFQDR